VYVDINLLVPFKKPFSSIFLSIHSQWSLYRSLSSIIMPKCFIINTLWIYVRSPWNFCDRIKVPEKFPLVPARFLEGGRGKRTKSYEGIISPLSAISRCGSEENYLSCALDGEPNFSLPVMGMCAPRIVIWNTKILTPRSENDNHRRWGMPIRFVEAEWSRAIDIYSQSVDDIFIRAASFPEIPTLWLETLNFT